MFFDEWEFGIDYVSDFDWEWNGLFGSFLICKLCMCINIFIINLLCVDIGVVIICMFFLLYMCLNYEWVLSDVLCKLNGFFNIVFCMSLFLMFIVISVEMYFVICKLLYYRYMS